MLNCQTDFHIPWGSPRSEINCRQRSPSWKANSALRQSRLSEACTGPYPNPYSLRFLNTGLNTIFPSTPAFRVIFRFRLSNQHFVLTSHSFDAPYTPLSSLPPWFNHHSLLILGKLHKLWSTSLRKCVLTPSTPSLLDRNILYIPCSQTHWICVWK
jgi:hypothetical protein